VTGFGGRPLPLRIERTFAAPVDAVFDAWTSVEVLRRWWPAGPGWTTPVAEVDLRGGWAAAPGDARPRRLRVRRHGPLPRDRPAVPAGVQLALGRPVARRGGQLVEVGFTANAGGDTTVVLVNRGLDDEAVRSHEEGWQLSFDNLDQVLAVRSPGAAR
jgi:uncharacterized protein YndB with AHSA1/START domain